MMYWRYTDAAGVERVGTVEKTSDRGGTDVTYFFRSTDGVLSVLSGSLVKNARPIGADPKAAI